MKTHGDRVEAIRGKITLIVDLSSLKVPRGSLSESQRAQGDSGLKEFSERASGQQVQRGEGFFAKFVPKDRGFITICIR